MALFARCTKDDVTMNNYLTRSKNLDYGWLSTHMIFLGHPTATYSTAIGKKTAGGLRSQFLPALLLHPHISRNIKKPTESVAKEKSNPKSKKPAKRAKDEVEAAPAGKSKKAKTK